MNPSNRILPTTVQIWAGTTWDSLFHLPELDPVSVRASLAPGGDEAIVRSEYGMVSNGGPWTPRTPLSLAGYCLQIRLGEPGGQHTIFEGIVRRETMQPRGTFDLVGGAVPNGSVLHRAEGLESILDRAHVLHSATAQNGNVPRLFAFNGDGDAIEPNRSAGTTSDATGTSHLFDWSATAQPWSFLNIAAYLARWASAGSGYTWTLDGQTAPLAKIFRQVRVEEGKTIRQLLNDIIRPQDGLAWRVFRTGSAACAIRVISLADVAIPDIDGTSTLLPANPLRAALDWTTAYDRTLDPPEITRLLDACYARIEVRGEPVRVAATLRHEPDYPIFVNDWTSAEQAGFLAAETDEERARDEYRGVFARFRLRPDWNGDTLSEWAWLEGEPQIKNILPVIDPDTGDMSLPALGPANSVPQTLVFERTWPDANGVERPSILQLWDGEAWVQPERSAEEDYPPVGLNLLETGPVVQLTAQSNVQLAPPDLSFPDTEFVSAWNPRDEGFRLRTSFFTNETVRVAVNTGNGSGTKRIEVPEAHLWIDADYNDGLADPPYYRILRDDRDTLRRLARMLALWYGQERAILSLSSRVPPAGSNLGRMVDSAYSNGAWTPIRTVVSTESYDWKQRGMLTYHLETSFADLDWSTVSRRTFLASERSIRRRLARFEARMQEIPLRVPVGGQGGGLAGGGKGVLFVVVSGLHAQSPASGTCALVGSVYALPSGGTALVTGATILVYGVAAGTLLASDFTFAPRMAAVPLGTVTWTGTAGPVTEEAYALLNTLHALV